jgi:transposase InsO family protein
VIGFSRSAYYEAKQPKEVKEKGVKDAELLEKIQRIKLEHPFWGYRRLTAWLVYREKFLVNHKKVRRLMKENGLMVTQTVHKAKRAPQRSKPRAEKPRQYWGIDMTKFMIPRVGWDISIRSKAEDWKRALEMGINNEFPKGVRGQGLSLISDNGSQPTARSFMKDTANLEIEQIFTSYNNPKGNADTERMMRTIKEEILWINEFSSLEEAKEKLNTWFKKDYNKNYVHSTLEFKSPEEFEKQYYENLLKKVA